MPAHALVDVTCPCCQGRFTERANLLRDGGRAWCPYCEKLFALDAADEGHKATLDAARLARQRRKQRLNDLRQMWRGAPTPAARPLKMSDVLRRLDGLLEQLDTLPTTGTRTR